MDNLNSFLKDKNKNISDVVETIYSYVKDVFSEDLKRVGEEHDIKSEIYLFALENREELSHYENPFEVLKVSFIHRIRRILNRERLSVIEAERENIGSHADFMDIYGLNHNMKWIVAISAQYAYKDFFKGFSDEEKDTLYNILHSQGTLNITELLDSGAFGEQLSLKIRRTIENSALPEEVLSHLFAIFLIHRLKEKQK